MRTGVWPFTVGFGDGELDDLRERLARTRFAPRTAAEPWASGADPDYLRRLVAYWADGFDWRAQERRLNAHPQYLADVGGARLHFVHERGVRPPGGPEPLPLVLTHGWPSCFAEILPLVSLLADPGAHGADPADFFDVVVPSLPGFLFSGVPAEGPLTMLRIAELWAELMERGALHLLDPPSQLRLAGVLGSPRSPGPPP